MDLYTHSPIHLNGVVLSLLNTGAILPLPLTTYIITFSICLFSISFVLSFSVIFCFINSDDLHPHHPNNPDLRGFTVLEGVRRTPQESDWMAAVHV
jgi:hypothetical protein